MSDTEIIKTKADYLGDVTTQLKEMRHYAQANTETLSSHWLAFDQGEYKDDEYAKRFDTLLNKQGQLLDDIDKTIQDLEIAINNAEQGN